MGMFDEVVAECPRCERKVSFQSKAGECYLHTYYLEDVPAEIALDIDGTSVKCECGNIVTIHSIYPIPPIPMRVE